MPDFLDMAKDYEDHQLQQIINNRPDMSEKSETYCIDCECKIPEKRRAIGGIKRCVLCQIEEEKRVKKYGR